MAGPLRARQNTRTSPRTRTGQANGARERAVSAQPWVCSSCRSVNQPREKRCYSCRTPRDLVEADPKTLLVAGAGSKPSTEPKPVGTFRSSGDLAFLTQVLIVAAL